MQKKLMMLSLGGLYKTSMQTQDMSNEKVLWGANKVFENVKLDKICGSYLASQMKLSRIEKIT